MFQLINKIFHKKPFLILLLCLVMGSMSVYSVCAQQKIRLQGTIKSIPGNEAISYVSIVLDGYVIGESDVEGKFVVSVARDAMLNFSKSGYNDVTLSVDGRQQADVVMNERILEVDEVLVIGTQKIKKLTIEPADIEVRGDHFYFKTRFRIPAELFTTDRRLVVQPTVYNMTTGDEYNLRPVVIDGEKYSIVQHRYLDFDSSNDKLNEYIVDNNINRDNDIYTYADSLSFDRKDLNDKFRVDCYLTLVDSHERKVPILMDTITVASGLQNVMRFFTHSLGPMNLDKSYVPVGSKASLVLGKQDSLIMPKVEMQLKNTDGAAYVEFNIGRHEIDYTNPKNKANIDAIRGILSELQSNESASIKSISMIGYSSPDGNVVRNQKLADRRTKELLNVVTSTLSDEMRKYVTLSSKGVVLPWSSVVDLVEQDSLPIAKKLREIVTERNVKYHEWAIRSLPEYKKIIVPHYLPKLRKIDYNIEYSIFRKLSFKEILDAYNQGKEMSRYEYFQLILLETNDKRREEIELDAIRVYPNFAWAVNRVAIRLLLEGGSDLNLQLPVMMDERVPMSMVYNQVLMALNEDNFYMADSLVCTIDEYPETEYLRAVISTLTGNYENAYSVIADEGGLNEILILLGLKYNNEAYEKIKIHIQDPKYSQDSKSWYIYTVCANRVDDVVSAMDAMSNALRLDPSLADIAKIDSDVMDIYELVQPNEKENYDE